MAAAVVASAPDLDLYLGGQKDLWDLNEEEDDLFSGLQLHQRVLNWRMHSLDHARIDARQGLADLRRDQVELAELRNELATSTQLKRAAAQQHANNQKLQEAERRHGATMAARAEAAMHQSARLQDQQSLRMRELDDAEASLLKQRAEINARMSKVDSLFALYAERLGLTISRIAPHTVRVTFSLIDEKDPDRQFSFTLGSASSTTYTVSDCSVSLPALDQMVRRLNSDPLSPSALPTFACSMRRAFKEAAMRTER